jgi:hypothetical protein
MNLQDRVDLLTRLGEYILSDDLKWKTVKEKAYHENGWFIPQFIDVAVMNISHNFLQKKTLENWAQSYQLPTINSQPKTIGFVMAGNIPLVGFHDFLTVFITGNQSLIKPSSKDEVLIKHLADVLIEWKPEVKQLLQFSERLKNCDAYIATGGNNTSRYFEYYFGKFPHIIRKNKTSVAVITGNETNEELNMLADDVYLFFGLGCRNVTKIYVPENYDFRNLLSEFSKYNYLADFHKYKNNFDYNLALQILNNKFYMTNGSIVLVENPSLFSPIGQLNYKYYSDKNSILSFLHDSPDLQCIVGHENTQFGKAQHPAINDYADNVDTMNFLRSL